MLPALWGHVRDRLLIMCFVSAMGWYGCPCMVGFVWPSCGFHMAGSLVFVLGLFSSSQFMYDFGSAQVIHIAVGVRLFCVNLVSEFCDLFALIEDVPCVSPL